MKSKERASGTAKLTPEVTPATRKLHAGLSKEFSALLIQLRTGVIGFNDFLFRRRVPTIFSPRCACDSAAMTVHHILLDCPIWTEPRRELLGTFHSKDLRKLLNDRKGAIAAIKFVLHTDLLAQFGRIARQERAKRQGHHQHQFRQPEIETVITTSWEQNVLVDYSASDISQSESEDASAS